MSIRLIRIEKHSNGKRCVDPQDYHVSLREERGDPEKVVCTGELLRYGEDKSEYYIKIINAGGVSCEACISKIRKYKKIRLSK